MGGGPAGLSAALTAARLGLPCVLFEKGEIGGNIQCAEGIYDPAGVLTMEKAFIRTRIRHARLHVNGRSFTFDIGSRNRFFVIDRGEWRGGAGPPGAGRRRGGARGRARGPVRAARRLPGGGGRARDVRLLLPLARVRSAPASASQWTLEGDFSAWANTIDVKILEEQPGYFWIFPRAPARPTWVSAG